MGFDLPQGCEMHFPALTGAVCGIDVAGDRAAAPFSRLMAFARGADPNVMEPPRSGLASC